jgi:hypothetical protein
VCERLACYQYQPIPGYHLLLLFTAHPSVLFIDGLSLYIYMINMYMSPYKLLSLRRSHDAGTLLRSEWNSARVVEVSDLESQLPSRAVDSPGEIPDLLHTIQSFKKLLGGSQVGHRGLFRRVTDCHGVLGRFICGLVSTT